MLTATVHQVATVAPALHQEAAHHQECVVQAALKTLPENLVSPRKMLAGGIQGDSIATKSTRIHKESMRCFFVPLCVFRGDPFCATGPYSAADDHRSVCRTLTQGGFQ